MGSAFLYQGQITMTGVPVNGPADLDFILWDTGIGGTPIGPIVSHTNIQVENGLFSVVLDFGAEVFNGDKRWLEIHVRSPHDPTDTAPFTPLSPRQYLAPAPTALALPAVRVENNPESPNVIAGSKHNSVTAGVVGATISGGGGTGTSRNRIDDDYGTIGGGSGNTTQAVGAVVGGGVVNSAGGKYATVPGGLGNTAYGDYSFAAGWYAGVRSGPQTQTDGGDEGTFVWSDRSSGGFVSTGPNQFLVRAVGGAGFGTNTPRAGLHVKREPNTVGGTLALEGVTHTFMSFYPSAMYQRKAYIGFGGPTTTLAVANEWMNGDIVLLTNASTGQVGINVFDPFYALELPNSADVAVGRGRANAWSTYSSIRWKENIRAIADPLGKVMRLNGVSFDWKPEHGGTPDIGFVAEEVGEVVPEIVTWEEDGEFALGLNYDRITALAVEAIKAQQAQIEELRAENAALAARLAAIEERLK